ncbi:hypothetical protein [Cellulophaga sp. Hel_I_12]|uniref:hypothetical protein n=1 Tax=Cellulophaga sp. Hel_I_12 TaxID=1249972 RepID=UPI0006483FF0|nr:hypothetical protein [Cellulophaga sp. Hel_I_12]
MIHRITDKKDWKKVLEAMDNYDFYHTYDYHNLSKLESQTPVLFFYKKNTTKIALPLLIQPIENTAYFDATSVYGYAGPIVSNLEENDLQEFSGALNSFLENEKIIAVFSRLNPLIKNQELVLSRLGTIVELGKVVAIKLDETLENQRANYSKITKRYLSKLKKTCTIVKSDTPEDVLKFIPLYYETMNRVSAESSYFFDEAYFLNLMRSTDFKTEIIFAILNDTQEIVSAALMIKTQGKIIQYHLSGTREEYLDKSPLRLIIDQTRINGTEQNFQCLNLGGGIGSKADSLFQFKATFSNTYKNFKVWKYIVNQKKYDEICLSKGFNQISDETGFFPIYRSPTVIYDK